MAGFGLSDLFGLGQGGGLSSMFNQRSGASGGIFSNVLQMFTQPIGQIGDGALNLGMAPLRLGGGILSSIFNFFSGAESQPSYGIVQNDPRMYSQPQQLANNNYVQPNPIGNFFGLR